MHMISKKDLSDAEMDTLTKSCSLTIVITANGEVQTHEEAIVFVKELDIFLTMKVLENTPAVLSLGKLCDENGYSYEWIHGQKPHLIKDGIQISLQYGELRSYCGSRLVKFVLWIFIDFEDTFETGESFFIIFFSLNLLHLQQVKFRFENGKMGIAVTPLQCKCQLRLMMGQGNLLKPKPIKYQK